MVCLFFCLAWRTALPRRYPRVADLLFAAAASILVGLDASNLTLTLTLTVTLTLTT